jgi:hypothetical protein
MLDIAIDLDLENIHFFLLQFPQIQLVSSLVWNFRLILVPRERMSCGWCKSYVFLQLFKTFLGSKKHLSNGLMTYLPAFKLYFIVYLDL